MSAPAIIIKLEPVFDSRRPTNPKRSDCDPDPLASMQMTEESYYRTDRELDNGRTCAGIYEDDRRYRISPRTAAIIGIPTLDFVPRTPLAADLVVSHHDKNETEIFRATKLLTSVDHHNPAAGLHHHNPAASLHHLYEMPQITSLNNVTDVNAC